MLAGEGKSADSTISTKNNFDNFLLLQVAIYHVFDIHSLSLFFLTIHNLTYTRYLKICYFPGYLLIDKVNYPLLLRSLFRILWVI